MAREPYCIYVHVALHQLVPRFQVKVQSVVISYNYIAVEARKGQRNLNLTNKCTGGICSVNSIVPDTRCVECDIHNIQYAAAPEFTVVTI